MIEEIRIFIAVTEAGNFSQVARSLDVAVSSVTRKVDALEAELAVKLFLRTSRRVMLTDAGEQFLSTARNIVADLEDAKDALSALQADPRGLLTVAAPSSFGRRHVSPAVISFLKQYPQIEINLSLSDQVVDLSVQRIDVAIRIGRLPDSDLVATRLAPLRRIACAAPSYLERYGTPMTPEALLGHNCLTVISANAPNSMWSFSGSNRNRALPVRGTLRTDDTESLLLAALEGIGIAHLASWMVSDMLAKGRLVPLFSELPQSLPKESAAIHAVRMPGRSHIQKAQLFIAHLKREFGEPAYWDLEKPKGAE